MRIKIGGLGPEIVKDTRCMVRCIKTRFLRLGLHRIRPEVRSATKSRERERDWFTMVRGKRGREREKGEGRRVWVYANRKCDM